MTPPRIGRILSLGFPLPGVRIDNYTFISAPSFFDYDALVVEPQALSQLMGDVIAGAADARTFAGSAVRVRPEDPTDVALEELIARRADETARLLARGGAVIVFGRPPLQHRLHEGVTIMTDAWLAHASPPLLPADGTQAEVSDYQHPLAAFVAAHLADLRYAARADEQALRGETRVFVRSRGAAILGFDYPAGTGRVVVLPALRGVPGGDARYRLSEDLQAGIQRLLGVAGEGVPPPWLARHPLPGLPERAAALREARAARDDAERALAAALDAHDALARYQRLLWQRGRHGLEDAVLDALRLLGCQVYDANRDEIEIRIGDTPVLLEIEASDGEIDMAPHHRLRQRLERAIERRGTAPRGLIVINGYRNQPPDERPAQASPSLRLAAEQMQYGICPTTVLYAAVEAKLHGDDAGPQSCLSRLVSQPGLLA